MGTQLLQQLFTGMRVCRLIFIIRLTAMLINRSFETRINTILDQLIGTCFAQARNSSQLPHTRQPLFHDVNFPWWLLPVFFPV